MSNIIFGNFILDNLLKLNSCFLLKSKFIVLQKLQSLYPILFHLRDALYNMAVLTGLAPTKESRYLLPGDDICSADVFIPLHGRREGYCS